MSALIVTTNTDMEEMSVSPAAGSTETKIPLMKKKNRSGTR